MSRLMSSPVLQSRCCGARSTSVRMIGGVHSYYHWQCAELRRAAHIHVEWPFDSPFTQIDNACDFGQRVATCWTSESRGGPTVLIW